MALLPAEVARGQGTGRDDPVRVAWATVGYSFAFADGNSIIGGFDYACLHGVNFDPVELLPFPAMMPVT